MNRILLFVLLLALSPMWLSAQVDETKPIRITKAVAFAKTAPLRELAAKLSPDKADALVVEQETENEFDYDKWPNEDPMRATENIQNVMGHEQSRGPGAGFSGQGGTGYYPPDTDGDVSETYYVQAVNVKYNVYLKDGTKILGPLNLSTLWNSLPGPWVGTNDGDPIVVYDEAAQRWVITQFSLPNSSHNYELFAISETDDPTGSFYLYAFEFGVKFNDYPKIGVWKDAYYATYNQFSNNYNPNFLGADITAVDREKMLAGDPNAGMIEFFKSGYYSTQPADIDGENLPDDGAPCPIMYITSGKKIELWDFHADWDTPNNSSLTLGVTLTPAYFSKYNGTVPQPNGQSLDALGNMIMYRLAYRKFDDHESMVANHTVVAAAKAGVRWYEFRRTTGDWDIYQQGTYAPADGNYRWMGSAAINANGDIAIAYSVSNGTDINPSIRYTGRRDGDVLGEMTVEEVELKTGTTSQSSFSRWGDYSTLSVDPDNDTAFWFTTEYNGWKTWIASFTLDPVSGPSCNAGPDAYICRNDQFMTQGSGSGVLSMQWTTDGDGFFSPDNQYNVTYIRGSQDVANGGCTLTLTVTGFDGVTTFSDDTYLNIVPFANAGEDASILDNESYQLQGQGSATGTASWSTSGDGIFSDASSLTPIYTPGTADINNGGATLTLNVAVTAPCEDDVDDSMFLELRGVGISKIEQANKLSIFPNPTNNIFTLNIDGLTTGNEFTFFVYTSYGKEVYRQMETAQGSSYKRVIDMSDFVGGVYFVTVKTDKGSTTMKVIKK